MMVAAVCAHWARSPESEEVGVEAAGEDGVGQDALEVFPHRQRLVGPRLKAALQVRMGG